MLPLIVPVLLCSLAAQPVAGQPDAKALHEAAVAATDKLTAVSYTAELRATGPIAAGMPPATGTVLLARGGSSFEQIPARFAIDAKVGGPEPETTRSVLMTFDGKTMTLLDHTARQFSQVAANDPMAMMSIYDPAMNLLVWNFIEKEAWGAGAEIVGFAHAGEADIAGVKCDIVVVEHSLDGPPPADAGEPQAGPDQTLKVREFIGAEDHLLRRLEFPLDAGAAGPEPSVLTISLRELSTDPKLEEARFLPAIPEGYAPRPVPDLPAAPEPVLKIGDAAPAWTLNDPEGKSHSLADYKGNVVLMDFWATWCGPCRAAMPGVQKLHEQFKDRGVAVLGMNIGEDEDADPAGYMKSKGFTYGLLLKAEDVAEAYGVMSIPHFFVVGVDGTILHASVGFNEEETGRIAELIEAHLKAAGR